MNGVSVLIEVGLVIWMWLDDANVEPYIVAGISFMVVCMVCVNTFMTVYYWKLGTPKPEIVSEKVNWKKEGF